MNDEFIDYLESIGITGNLIERINSIYTFYTELIPEEIEDIFITDYIKEDGSREYENLWFFSEKHIVEAKQFILIDDFDFVTNKMIYWHLTKKEYDFNTANEESRLTLSCKLLHSDRWTTFKAAKENCDKLKSVFKKYIMPNMIE